MPTNKRPVTVDPAQLDRIEVMHRGFLFQHFYAVRALLLAPGKKLLAVVVEGDEDLELVHSDGRA